MAKRFYTADEVAKMMDMALTGGFVSEEKEPQQSGTVIDKNMRDLLQALRHAKRSGDLRSIADRLLHEMEGGELSEGFSDDADPVTPEAFIFEALHTLMWNVVYEEEVMQR